MIRFRDYLGKKLKNDEFAKGFERELQFARLAVALAEARENQKLTQTDLASRARITQQQLSKVENAMACKVETLLKVCDALGMDLVLSPRSVREAGAHKRHAASAASPKRTAGKTLPRRAKSAARRPVVGSRR